MQTIFNVKSKRQAKSFITRAQRALGVKCVMWNQDETHSEANLVSYSIVKVEEIEVWNAKPKISWCVQIISASDYFLKQASEALQKIAG